MIIIEFYLALLREWLFTWPYYRTLRDWLFALQKQSFPSFIDFPDSLQFLYLISYPLFLFYINITCYLKEFYLALLSMIFLGKVFGSRRFPLE